LRKKVYFGNGLEICFFDLICKFHDLISLSTQLARNKANQFVEASSNHFFAPENSQKRRFRVKISLKSHGFSCFPSALLRNLVRPLLMRYWIYIWLTKSFF